MNKSRWVAISTLLLVGLTLQGCKTTGSATGPDVVDGTGQDGATTYGVDDGSMGSGPYAGMTEQQLMSAENLVIYFDYDQSTIRYEFRALLNAHAEYLNKNPQARVVFEGHADERGTREYNLALGERRANSVASYLSARGVNSSQMESISYGEEKPIAFGHEESSWSQNRRVEFKYTAR